ncbi:methyl-accepting chemotaxis protein [Campylobacter sp. LR291e]|uniref:methyl-accepting chemotaxis protein n=1 Tax=Campylobacter sp. LR291e TaxID=2593546 RepID=UPI00123A72B8|nr:methyl-accepting chemotaxis protein [Campylobacter sp. LR291e]KAA6233648.1 methyl-accepting chemotaxis protein [Campylobacter sp. LR291e]
MFKSIGFKVSVAILLVLLLSFIIVQIIINLDFKNSANKMSRENLDTVSTSVFQTLRMSMNLGDPQVIHDAIENAKKIEGISDVIIYPSKEIIELFEIQNPNTTNETLIIEQFSKPELKSLQTEINGINYIRLIRPLIADDETCLTCHATTKLNDVMGVMDIYHSLEHVENDIARASRNYIIIFSLALIITVAVVLFMLKIVVGNPIVELLNHAKELAQGDGNLRARIKIKGKDEIAGACSYINQFIEKTQKTVSSVHNSSKKVETQAKTLNSNAIALDEVTEKSHKKIDEGFHLSENVGTELGELATLSSEASKANDKSYEVLTQMLNSLSNVANKVTSAVDNENLLAVKVKNMMEQASNIQKTAQMMDEIADKTNLLSLNAGIEAARAGEHGRGFSIIAEDVRILAQNSEEFVGSVTQITKELLASMKEVSDELTKNAENINSLNDDTSLLVNDANEVQISNKSTRDLVLQCTDKIKSAQENMQNLLSCMQENVEASEQNEGIAKLLLGVVDELKIVCNNLEKELKQFEV